MSRRKAEMILELVDRATGPARRFMAMQKRMGKAVEASNRTATRSAQKAERAASRTERTFSKLGRTAINAFRATARGARQAGRAVFALHRKTVALGKNGIGQIGNGFGRARTGLMAGAAAVTLAYGTAAAAASGLVGTASEFERFQTILMTTEGSAGAAKEAMGWVQNFAVKTPYELDQVTDAFVQLRAYGLDPTQGLLQSLGDTSAAMGKPLSQAVEAIADAVTGENERLKEFGIKASKTGNQITYEYTNAAGETVRTAVEAGNRMAIQQTLMAIMNEKYAGSMDRLSKTWEGMISNVFDLWTKFQMMIMDAGLFDWMKGKLETVLETINQMEADGTLQEWATQISNTIKNALIDIWEFGKGVFEFFTQVKGYLSIAAEYVGGWKNLSMILAGIAFAPTLISTAAGIVQIATGIAMLSAALLANPIILIIAAIAGAAYLIYRNWDKIVAFFQRIWAGVKAAFNTAVEWINSAIDGIRNFDWTSLFSIGGLTTAWSGVSGFLGPVLGTLWDTLSPLSWAGIVKAEDLSAAWSSVTSFLSDAPAKLWDGIKAIGWNALIGLQKLREAWNAVKSWAAGKGADLWEGITSIEWASLINLAGVQEAWNSVTSWFAGVAANLWDLIPDMPEWKFSLWGEGDQVDSPETVLQAAEAAKKLETAFPAINAAAGATLSSVTSTLTQITTQIQGMDLTAEGARIATSIADGIRSQIGAVTAAAAAMSAAIKSAMPSGANVNVSLSGGGAPVQARATGGAFNPGWLLTGERGPELEYRNKGGYIAHNQALQSMVAMSQTVARNAANANQAPGWMKGAAVASGLALGASLPAAADLSANTTSGSGASIGAQYLNERNSGGGSGTGPISVTMTFTGRVDQQAMPDIRAMKDELIDELRRLQADDIRAEKRRGLG